MAHLRIAAVQLDYQPVTRTSVGGWRLDEPLAPLHPLDDVSQPGFLLDTLKIRDRLLRDICEKAMKESRHSYIANLTEKLREIMTFCYRNKVDLVVLPEYSVPLESLEALRSFSNSMAIVAGIGYLRRADLKIYQDFGIDVDGAAPGSNVAILLSPQRNLLISKKSRAEGEQITSGSGSRIETMQLTKGAFELGISICLDFLQEKARYYQDNPHVVAIPALSRNVSEFVDETPRNFVRVFANHAAYGGTYIGAPRISGLRFCDQNGSVPLEGGVEGIVIVDWDYDNPWPVKPTKTPATNHKLYARATIAYGGRDREISERLSRIAQMPEDALRMEDMLQLSVAIRGDVEHSVQHYPLLRDSLDVLEENSDTLAEDELRFLSRHCVLSINALTVSEWKYKQCIAVAEHLKRLQDRLPEIVSAPYGEYEKIARELAKDVRVNLLELRHKGPAVSADSETLGELQLVILVRLGAYGGEDAIRSLPRQLTLLRTIADLQDQNLCLRYRLQTWRDSTNIMHALYDVICTTRGYSQEEIDELRQGLGQLIHITFTGAYSISYTLDQVKAQEETADIRQSTPWWVEIGRVADKDGIPLPFRGTTDWGLIIDLLRSLNELTVVELHCTGLPHARELTDGEYSTESRSSKDEYLAEGSMSAAQLFLEMLGREHDDPRRLSLRVFVGSKEPVPTAIVNSIGIELAGANHFQLLDRTASIITEGSDTHRAEHGLNPVAALRIFHPPFGRIYSTAGEGKYYLDLATNESQFPPTGILLGKARIRQVRADEEIDVRLSEVDRLRHLYVVGKTGTGKTNLLKAMAAQDVQVPGRGVTIVDPHGDLVDHVLREIPESRLNEVTLIDLTRTDALPVLNPLDLDRKDRTLRDRTIQEIIWLLHSRVYHEYTGPRFDELVRLAFQTMLDEGYPEPASFVEVSRIFMDEDAQSAAVQLIRDEELRRRWRFQDTVRQDRGYGELIHWVTSKFEDIARDSTLRVVMGGGRSTVNIEQIVNQNGILLVRIPEAVIGKQAADFVGSLILLQLRMAIIRRREFGKLQSYHFVYVDEFQNFANTDFHTLVAEARKFNIGFTLANQNLEQLREFRTYTGVHEQRLINAIFGNVGNLIAFGVGAFDADFLSKQFNVSAEDIMRVGRYEALAKLLVNGFDTTPFTLRIREAIRLESPRNTVTIEARMKESCWKDPEETLKEIDGRMNRVIQRAQEWRNAPNDVLSVPEEVADIISTHVDKSSVNEEISLPETTVTLATGAQPDNESQDTVSADLPDAEVALATSVPDHNESQSTVSTDSPDDAS